MKKSEIIKRSKEEAKSKVELSKLKKQSFNQAKANMLRLEKAVYSYIIYRIHLKQ